MFLLGPNPGTRSVNLQFMFEDLGHVVHLVEDMAQPEHTRNDQHLTYSNLLIPATAASIWEGWSNQVFTPGPDAFFSGYPVVKMPNFKDYFHDAGGRGLADFSSRNFFTQDTNEYDERPPATMPPAKGCYTYPSPIVDPSTGVTEFVTEEYYLSGIKVSDVFEETRFSGPIDDNFAGSHEQDNAQTVLSTLDFETRTKGVSTYSLNDSSYYTRGAFLLPRAVGYAAGAVDHFFRGSIEAEWSEIGNSAYKLVLTNKSNEPIGADAKLVVAYKRPPEDGSSDDLGIAFPLTSLSAIAPGFTGLAPGASITIPNVTPSGLPAGTSLLDFERRIIVYGTLGTESGAVIPLIQQAEKG
jgi:hypothetical protein